MKKENKILSALLSMVIVVCSISFPMSVYAKEDYVKVGGADAGGRYTYYSKSDKLVIDAVNRYLPNMFIYYFSLDDEYSGGYTLEKGDEQLNDSEIKTIKSVCINNGVTIIGYDPFFAFRSLEEVTLPKTLKRILAGTFSSNKNLKVVNFGGSEQEWKALCIDRNNDCLKNAKINYNVDVKDSRFIKQAPADVKTESRYVSETIKITLNYYTGEANIVGKGAIPNVSNDYGQAVEDLFGPQCYDCYVYPLVNSINVQEGITEIGGMVFCDTSAEKIYLPKSIKKVNSRAFNKYSNTQILKTVYYNGSAADWDKISISKTDNDELFDAKLVFSKKATSNDINASLSTVYYNYDKKTHTPSVTVKNTAGKTLVRNKDYRIIYGSAARDVGKYFVRINLIGNYQGTKTLYYYIRPKSTSISSIIARSRGFCVKWKKQSLKTTGYQIQYATNSRFNNAKTVTVTKNSTVSKTISKLSPKKKYYVRVRIYKTVKFNGKDTRVYSSWSKSKYVTTKK